MGDAVSACDVAGPHPGDEAVDRAVRLRDQVVFVAERDRGHDRAEDLLASDAHLAVDVGEDRRLDEVTRFEPLRAAAAREHPRPLLVAERDVAEHALHLRLRDQRAHLGDRVDARADARVLHRLEQLGEGLVVDLLLDEQPRAGGAHLALVEEDAEEGA